MRRRRARLRRSAVAGALRPRRAARRRPLREPADLLAQQPARRRPARPRRVQSESPARAPAFTTRSRSTPTDVRRIHRGAQPGRARRDRRRGLARRLSPARGLDLAHRRLRGAVARTVRLRRRRQHATCPGPWALLRYVPLDRRGAHADALRGRRRARSRSPLRRRARGARPTLSAAALARSRRDRRRCCSSSSCRRRARCIPRRFRRSTERSPPIRVRCASWSCRSASATALSSAGNFSARYQYFQTLHGKRLMGGYLSRISKRRVGRSAIAADARRAADAERGPTPARPSMRHASARARRLPRAIQPRLRRDQSRDRSAARSSTS